MFSSDLAPQVLLEQNKSYSCPRYPMVLILDGNLEDVAQAKIGLF